ncbi:MAG: T9SS type A sorting domain-containing protein [Saprospiraceae bacterium]|nr:T9SS type A sorting domain-containing protein [Saprospiraceae bacterium]
MNVSIFRTGLLALLILPLAGWAQSVRPFPPVKVLQTDTFEYVYTTYNLTTIVRQPENADYFDILDLGGGQKKLVYSPVNSFEGRDTILVEYYPKLNGSQEYFGFSFLVAPSIVTANTDYVVTDHNTPVTVDALDNDETSSGSLDITDLVIVRFGTASVAANQITFTPEAGFTGNAQIGYNCCNQDGICATGVINIYVKPDSSPSLNDTVQIQLPKNSPKEIMLYMDGYDDVDVDPSNGSLSDLTHDVVVYEPNTNFTGSDVFQLSKDVGGETLTRTFVLSVFNTLADKRHAINDVVYTHVNTPVTFNVLTNDVGAFTVIYPNQIQVSAGSLVYLGNGQFTYTPAANYSGIARFTYSLGSPAYGIIVEQANVEINVNNFNPRLPTYSLQTKAGKPLVIRYSPPAEPWSFQMKEEPLHGSAEIFDGLQTINVESQNVTGYNLIVYTPEAGFADDYDEFEVEYCINGSCKSVKFLIHVLPNPDPGDLQCVEACVWPGDANNDGIVNVRDLLAIGYALGINGPDRMDPTSDWTPQFSDAWEDPWTAAQLDLKFLDTDGDGLISALDTLAISQSYQNTHTVTTTAAHQLTTDIDLRFLLRDPSLYGPDTSIILDILYGLENKPAYDAYGFTFEIDFADVVDVDGKSVRVTYYNDSWFARQIPTLSMFKRLDNTIIHSGYTKTDGMGGVGYGPVGFVIVDDIEGARPPRLRASSPLPSTLTVRNITVMNQHGEVFYLPDQEVPLVFDEDQMVDVTEEQRIGVFPNPAMDVATIYHKNSALIESIELYHLSGSLVYQVSGLSTFRYELPTSSMVNGLYLLRVKSATGVSTHKLEVMR